MVVPLRQGPGLRLHQHQGLVRPLKAAAQGPGEALQYGTCLSDGGVGSSDTHIRRPPLADRAHFLEEEEVIGFSAHEKELMELLVKDAEPRRALVAVYGMPGVGKTTLVMRVYKQLVTTMRHFNCSARVVVSQHPRRKISSGRCSRSCTATPAETTPARATRRSWATLRTFRPCLFLLDQSVFRPIPGGLLQSVFSPDGN